MLSGLFPPEKRSRMMGLWNMSIPLGIAVGIAVGGFVAQHWGWRHAFGLVALPGAIAAVLFFFVKDYKTVDLVKSVGSSGAVSTKARMSKMDIFREFIHTPSLILTNIGFIGCIFVNNAIIVWLPTYLHRVDGISMSEAGTKVGAIMLLAIIGLPVGGWLTDVWFKKNVSSRMLFPSLTIALNAVVILTAFSFLDGKAQYTMLLLMGVLASMFAPAAIIVTQEVIHPGLRAISYSVCVVFQNLFGASMAPIVIGALSDAYGIKVAMSILPVFLLASAVLARAFASGFPSRMEDLLTMPGVGRKTANVVLGTCFGVPAIIVDTHVRRVSQRLGLASTADPDGIERELQALLPAAGWTDFSHRLTFHGRRRCHARKPDCGPCPLARVCPSRQG